MKKILFASAMFLFSIPTGVFCQTDNPVVNNAVSQLKSELSGHVIEKAYLHFDRAHLCYIAGDTVYFKAYVTMGETHELSKISGVLHADLIGSNNAVMQTIALRLNNGTAWGDFALPDTLHKGAYKVRAYTQYMRNDEHPYFFDQDISVTSVNNIDKVVVVKQSIRPSLQFFPEGGNLVVDLPSKVAFKTVGSDGLGIAVKGVIADNDNKEVCRMVSNRLGMGTFYMLPEEGKTYKAKITYADGSQAVVELPPAAAKGITLAVNYDDPAKISIEIKANRLYYKENLNKDLHILVYNAGNVRTVTTKLDNSVLGLDLPSNTFRTGILQVTLLSGAGEPLNERLAFIRNDDLLNLSLNTNKPLFARNENTQLNFSAKDKDGKPANGSFSVSVVDESKVPVDEDAENTILSYLLLKSELKGTIEKPNYYFALNSKETRADLDALMLTQGYRRFEWKRLLDNTKTIATNPYMPEQSLNIGGTLQTKAGTPFANTNIFLIEGSGSSVLTQVTDAKGRFNFANVIFYSGSHFILKTAIAATGKDAAVIVLDKQLPSPPLTATNAMDANYNPNADVLASFQNNIPAGVITASNQSPGIILKNDNNKAAGPNADKYRSSKLGGSGNADQVLTSKDLLTSPTLSLSINGLLRGVIFSNGVPYLSNSQTISAGQAGNEPMLIVVDGVASAQGSTTGIDYVNPSDVETIEVLRGANAGLYGVRGGSGVLVITTMQTKANFVENKQMAPGVFAIAPVGFYKAREFYSPANSVDQSANPSAQNRTTIFWKPDVITGADGNSTFNFYNSNSAGNYRVVVEGIDDKGNLGRQAYTYKVQ